MKRVAVVLTVLALLWIPRTGGAQPSWIDQMPQELPGHISINYTMQTHHQQHDSQDRFGDKYTRDVQSETTFHYRVSTNVILRVQPDSPRDYVVYVDKHPTATAQTYEGNASTLNVQTQSSNHFRGPECPPSSGTVTIRETATIQGQNENDRQARLSVHREANGYRYKLEGLPFRMGPARERGSITTTVERTHKCVFSEYTSGSESIDRLYAHGDWYRGKSDQTGFYELNRQLSGSFDPKSPRINGHADVRRHDDSGEEETQIDWSFGGQPQDLEAVMWADGYDDWMPGGSLRGSEDESGQDPITVLVKLQRKGKPNERVNEGATFRFELVGVSSEPGIAMNWPPRDKVKGTPDLAIEQSLNQKLRLMGHTWQTHDSQAADTAETTDKGTEAQVVVSSFDFGAWGTLKVSADTAAGQHLVAHLRGDSSVDELRLPKDSDGNHIADAWKKEYGIMGAAAEADEASSPWGNGFRGDGLSLYERYRGFFYYDFSHHTLIHARLDPHQKALFVYPEDAAFLPGIDLFAQASGLQVYTIFRDQMDDRRVINFNGHWAHNNVDQHALRIVCGALDEYVGGRSTYGPPKNVENVEISCTGSSRRNATVAHELGHAVGMPHHGSGNYWRPNPQDPDRNVYVAVQHGENSGVEQGIMRYNWAQFIKRKVRGKWQYDPYEPAADGPRTLFAEQDGGTGVNAPNRAPWPKAGDASPGCGNSLRRLVVSDRYDVDLFTLFHQEGCD